MTDASREHPTADWQSLQARLRTIGHRRLILVEGSQENTCTWMHRQLSRMNTSHSLWVGRAEHAEAVGLPHLQANHYQQWLGRETSLLVWDGWQGNPPDAFAALAGTLQAGGLLFWLVPPLDRWRRYADPDYVRTGLDQAEEHPFAARLAMVIGGDASIIRVQADDSGLANWPELPAHTAGFTPQTTDEQQQLLQHLVRFGQGRRRRPLVITADRGRGKSAAMGIAAARLLLAGREQVLVTAPSRDNVDTLFRHAVLELGEELAEQSESELVSRTGHRLSYMPVPELLAARPAAEVVLVDEAAGLPAHWLRDILLGWPRVAFATTVHGYEGTGRGFAIRFREILDRETPHWRGIPLHQPVRWAGDDPLEQLVFRLFLLAAEGAVEPVPEVADVDIQPWLPADASEQELSQAFGLLVDAHYRTTPADLRQWLDDPGAQSWRAVYRGQTMGVLWGTVEGGIEAGLAEQVAQGRRRLRGHLLAQSLASHGGFPEAASLKTLRVVRIAVVEQARHLGIGRQLVDAAAAACRGQGLDAIGTSFGGNDPLVRFWQACDFRVVRLGLRQEASTGEFPVQMMRGLSDAGASLETQLRTRFARHWQVLVPRHWSQLEPVLMGTLGADLPPNTGPDNNDRRDLNSFAHGYRGFELSLPMLQAVSAAPGVMAWLCQQPDFPLWCRAVLQGWSWAALQAALLCSGQRDGEQRLRGLACQLLQNGPEL